MTAIDQLQHLLDRELRVADFTQLDRNRLREINEGLYHWQSIAREILIRRRQPAALTSLHRETA